MRVHQNVELRLLDMLNTKGKFPIPHIVVKFSVTLITLHFELFPKGVVNASFLRIVNFDDLFFSLRIKLTYDELIFFVHQIVRNFIAAESRQV